MVTRRQTIAMLAAGTAGAAALAVGVADWTAAPPGEPLGDDAWLATLGKSLRAEHDYDARVEGRLPRELRGTLYRNGPGLFERAGHRKRHLLDGDGMIQAFDFTDTGVRFRNRFVRTAKFVEEDKAGAYKYATWTTRAPGGMFANMGMPNVLSQAGVTTLVKDGQLLAFGEIGLPYALDPSSLATVGEYEIAGPGRGINFKAHTKTDARNGDWILIGGIFGPEPRIEVIVRARDGRVISRASHAVERSVYIHDFFATERHVIVLLHPLEFAPWGMLAGVESFVDTLTWRPEEGNRLLVFDRDGGAPSLIEAPGRFMWHSVNAYESNGEIIADFVGYDQPDHFIGDNPALGEIMNARRGAAKYPGEVRRYVIDVARRQVRDDLVSGDNFEFPAINLARSCIPHRLGYFAHAGGTWYHNGLAVVDFETGKTETFSFGAKHRVGEPIFAAKPGQLYDGTERAEAGWLLAEVLDGANGTSSLAVFDAEAIARGPIAKVVLNHHVPISFHGYWHAG